MAYAFSLVMTTGLLEKYGIACDSEKFVEKVKTLCPCWEGHETESMMGEWNEQHAKPGAAIEDVDQCRRYNVKVEYTKITSFEEARAEMKRQEALKLLMPCTISTDKQGHALHAVALRSTAPGGKMEAVNSWGADLSLLDITEANSKTIRGRRKRSKPNASVSQRSRPQARRREKWRQKHTRGCKTSWSKTCLESALIQRARMPWHQSSAVLCAIRWTA